MDENLLTKPRYLPEAISLDQFQKGCLNLVDTPCGSGKTIFALTKLPALATSKDHILYLLDTTIGVETLLKNAETKPLNNIWLEERKGTVYPFQDNVDEKDKITVMTYQKFGVLVNKHSTFLEGIEMIICDEPHKIYMFVGIEKGEVNQNNPALSDGDKAKLLSSSPICAGLSALENQCCYGDCYVVAMTATPRLVLERFGAEINNIVSDYELVSYKTHNRHFYTDLEQEMTRFQKGKQYIVYVEQVKQIQKYLSIAERLGLKAVGLWSPDYIYCPMSKEQFDVRQFIIDEERLPDDIDVLFINRAYDTSFNIRGDIEAMYIHYNSEDTITQVRGRYRNDLNHLYVYDKTGKKEIGEIVVPAEFLERKLFKEDTTKLVGILDRRNKKDRLIGWTTIHNSLKKQGYHIEKGREGAGSNKNRHYYYIHAPTNTENEMDE